MASTDTQIISYSPSSSSKSVDQFTYEVFLSFRGEDTRYGFTDYLYQALISYGIHTFRDDNELGRGRVIESELLNAIAKSKIFVIIFSENYATSRWCLDELVKINECMAAEQRLIIPIFYHVDPSEVQKQTGSYGKAFVDHDKEADEEKRAKIQKWRAVLTEVGNRAGHELKKDRSEVEFIQKIRKYVITILNRKPLHVGENIVGMDFHLEQLKPLIKTKLDEVHMVGICGIGGIGKTTISKALYNDISSQFDGSSFLANVGGKCNDDLLEVQKTLLQDILKDEGPKFSCVDHGINVIKGRLRSKRVLIVVDNVDDYSQLEKLVEKHGWYGAKSLIIITTRYKHLLARHEVKEVYEVQKLNPKKSADLFNWYAFKQNTPIPNFESLSDNIVKYCDGLPIALKVLGGHLFNKTIEVWNSALVKLEKTPNGEVQKLLRVSYDKLDYTEKCLFLDIACFFKGEDKDFVSRIFGSDADDGIEVLNDNCLITISENKLDMHDLLQKMGQQIVCEECIEEPGERSRLWDPKEVDSVLTRNTGTDKIEGLFVEISTSNREQFSAYSFTKLNRLRLLKVYSPWWQGDLLVHHLQNIEFPAFCLRYFHFENYPLESLPTNFHAKNLVELNLRNSNIKLLWKDNEILDKLKVINLSYSKLLVEIPKFSNVPNLEFLILKGCTSLKSLPSSIGDLEALKHLNLECCMNLRSLPKSICNLSSLETFILMQCSNLEGFPEMKNDMENLERLDLSETNIKELPYSIRHLKALKHLDLKSCAELVSLPKSICNLSSLETLILMGCSNLKELPHSIGHLEALKHLDLKSCAELVSLPESIWNLSSLETLEVSNCPKLERLEVKLGISVNPTCLILNGGIWWSNDRFSSLKTLDLQHNQMEKEVLNHHVFPLSSPTELYISDSEGEESGILNDSFHLSSLEVLSVGNLKIMEGGILDAIFHQSSLKTLSLRNCNLREASIRSDIGNLSSPVKLSLTNCDLMDGKILNHVCHLSSLERLSLEGSHFSSIPASISRLSHLRGLNLSHCNNLQEIPELPLSLRFLDVHCSKGILSSSPLLSIPSFLNCFNCFNSKLIEDIINVDSSWFRGEGMSIVIPSSSGIEKGIRNLSIGKDEVEIELPQHWYETDDLIGFALCCVYVPVLEDNWRLHGKLAIRGDYPSACKAIRGENPQVGWTHCCKEHNDDSLSEQVWVIYYPKDAIKEEYRSNQWTHLKASFHGPRALKVKGCGIRPIYSTHQFSFKVFLSFRGEDTRYGFTNHLHTALNDHGIQTFINDEELERGGVITFEILKAIEKSKIFVIIFSKNYATSRWCLDELVKISEYITAPEQRIILPIFYHVDPSEVQEQEGSYKKAFDDHQEGADEEKRERIQKWRAALTKVGNLAGYELKKDRFEAEFIQKIREKIISTLNCKSLNVGENIVGMDFHLKELKSLIETESDEVNMVGIYGTGGIGKTTISMAIYNDISYEFDGSSFLKDVGAKSEHDLVGLQKTLLQDILKCETPEFQSTNQGIVMIREKLRSKRVLIVVDDVDNYTQLKNFVGNYGARSLIIITTRNLHLLFLLRVEKRYEVNILDPKKSTELFCLWAFKQNTPKPNFESLSKRIVKCAGGLPIALRVYGDMLFGCTKDEWQSALDQLKKIPHEEVQRTLKVSYDKLDEMEKKMFLDIACFFRGEDKDFVSRIFGSYANIVIKFLHDSCLITIFENKLDMHDLLQQMGREIVRREYIEELGKRSRLWDPKDVESVLIRNTGTEKIEGLFVEICQSRRIQFSTNSFTKLNNLRLLKVYYQTSFWHTPLSQNVEVQLPVNFEFPSFALRYLHFEKYPLESLPIKFDGRNLVELNLRRSSIKQLWKDNETLNNLKVINLSYSEHLVKIPKLSSVPNLEILILTGCGSLVSLPKIKGNMSKLREIDLSETAIEELQSSIGHLNALKHLNLQYCVELVSLPESIWNLSSLETLEVRDCPKLERLEVTPKEFGPMCLILKGGIWWRNDCFSSLKTLNLQHNKMEGEVLNHHVFPLSSLVELSIRNSEGMERQMLSDSSHLSSLKVSSFGNFNPMTRGILSDIFHQSSLETLSLCNCNLMEEGIRSDIWNLSSLVKLSLTNCNLMEGEILNHVCHLSSLERLSLEGNHFSSIPAGISRLSHLRDLNLSHCNNLQEIPELPSSLRFLDVHYSKGILSSPSLLSIPSLLNWFNSELIEGNLISVDNPWFKGKGMSIVIPRSSGILEGIRNQSIGRDKVEIELPQHWYETNDLFGFAFCCVFVPVLDDELRLSWKFAIRGDYPLVYMGAEYPDWVADDCASVHCGHCGNEHNDDSISEQVWVIYYTKDAIKEEYRSNQLTRITASFHGWKTPEVKECGIHPIYGCFNRDSNSTNNGWRENSDFSVKRSLNDAEDHPKQDPHHKKSRHL